MRVGVGGVPACRQGCRNAVWRQRIGHVLSSPQQLLLGQPHAYLTGAETPGFASNFRNEIKEQSDQ